MIALITEQALNEAIAEVQGRRDPNRQDCMMLAAFYIIQDRLYPQPQNEAVAVPTYSNAAPREEVVGDYGDTEFLQTVSGMDESAAWLVMDDLMSTLQAINPRLYNGVIRELNQKGQV